MSYHLHVVGSPSPLTCLSAWHRAKSRGGKTDIGERNKDGGGEGEVSANKGEEKQQMGEGGDKWGQTITHAMR